MRRGRTDDEEFEGVLRAVCGRLGLLVASYAGDVVVLEGRLSGTVAVSELRARCRQEPRSRWTPILLEALGGLATSVQARLDLTDWQVVRPRLRTRVCTDGSLLLDDVARTPLCDGLSEVVVVDVEGALTAPPAEVVDGWGQDIEHLLELGRAAVVDLGPPRITAVDLGAVEVTSVETDHPFAASLLPLLHTLVELPAAGALVVMPTRHLLLVAPLRTADEAVDAAQALLVNAAALSEGPVGLSPDLWWWRDRTVQPVPGDATGLRPSPDLVCVLQSLPAR